MIDLHIHTKYSDGSFSVIDILKKAEKSNLEVISITDHDCVKAYNELSNLDIKEYYKGRIITGCEFKCVFTKYKLPVEILGYGFNYKEVEQFLEQYSNMKIQKTYLEHIKTIGNQIGLIFNKDISIDDKKTEYASAIFEKEILKNKENIKILNKNGVSIETNFYRDAQSNPKSIFYIDETKDYLTPNIIIDLIHKAGGIAFLAHPYIYKIDNKLKVIEDFINTYDIDGLECYYSLFNEEETNNLLELCKKYNLYISGGTDFHGTNKPDIKLGIGKGKLNISKNNIENWIYTAREENNKC